MAYRKEKNKRRKKVALISLKNLEKHITHAVGCPFWQERDPEKCTCGFVAFEKFKFFDVALAEYTVARIDTVCLKCKNKGKLWEWHGEFYHVKSINDRAAYEDYCPATALWNILADLGEFDKPSLPQPVA